MKKRIVNTIPLLAFILALTTSATAQVTDGETPLFGAKVGLNGSYLYTNNEDISDREGKFGVAAGLFTKVPINDVISFQPELMFSMKGDEYRYDQDESAVRVNMNYVELPVGLHFNLFNVVNLHAGGYAGYLVNSKFKIVDDDGSIARGTELDADDFNRWDYGWFAGAGLDFGNMGVSFRFNRGLNSIYKDQAIDLYRDAKNVNGTLALSFAF